jgi:hypothetical protein
MLSPAISCIQPRSCSPRSCSAGTSQVVEIDGVGLAAAHRVDRGGLDALAAGGDEGVVTAGRAERARRVDDEGKAKVKITATATDQREDTATQEINVKLKD